MNPTVAYFFVNVNTIVSCCFFFFCVTLVENNWRQLLRAYSVEHTNIKVFASFATVLKQNKSTDKLTVRSHIVIHFPSFRILPWPES